MHFNDWKYSWIQLFVNRLILLLPVLFLLIHNITDSVNMSEQTPGKQQKPGMLQFVGSQRVGHDTVTKQQITL